MKAYNPLEVIGRIQSRPEYAEVVRLKLLSANSFGCWIMRADSRYRSFELDDELAMEGADFFDIFLDEEPSGD